MSFFFYFCIMCRFAKYFIPFLFLSGACQKNPSGEEALPGDVSLTVETVALYDELEITDTVGNLLASGELTLVDSVFVYGNAGRMMARSGKESQDLSPMGLSLPGLENGNYTIVLFQFCRPSNGTCPWQVKGVGDLASVHIERKESPVEAVCALGIAGKSVTVTNGNIQASLSPKAMGRILDLRVDGYQKDAHDPSFYDLPTLNLYGDASVSGVYLDPARIGGDRWQYDSREEEVIACMEEDQTFRQFFLLGDAKEQKISLKVPTYT